MDTTTKSCLFIAVGAGALDYFLDKSPKKALILAAGVFALCWFVTSSYSDNLLT